MITKELLSSINKYGNEEETLLHTLGISASDVCENVIVSPGWLPTRLFDSSEIKELVNSGPLFGYQLWNIDHKGIRFTYIRTGFGAPVVMDAVLLLHLTRCKTLLFVSSVGALSDKMRIGDVLIPQCSACGDGASRYLSADLLQDNYGERQYPDKQLLKQLSYHANRICADNGAVCHMGKTFCVDTIVAQSSHLKTIINWGYDSIDMESAAAMKAAAQTGISAAALLHVSDNSVLGKSLLSGRGTQKDGEYRAYVRRQILPQIIESVF